MLYTTTSTPLVMPADQLKTIGHLSLLCQSISFNQTDGSPYRDNDCFRAWVECCRKLRRFLGKTLTLAILFRTVALSRRAGRRCWHRGDIFLVCWFADIPHFKELSLITEFVDTIII